MKGKLKGTKMDQAVSLENTEVSEIPLFQGDHLDFVQYVVKDFTGKELVSHLLIVSQELGKRSNPSSTSSDQMF